MPDGEDSGNNNYYLISGRPVHHPATANKMRDLKALAGSHLKSCYWASEYDLNTRGYKVRTGAAGGDFQWTKPGESVSRFEPKKVLLYNVEQLVVPDEGFKIAGLKNVL